MASTKYFYVHGDDIGLVAESTSGSDDYSPNATAATMKLFGRFQQTDLSGETDVPSLINSRNHIAIAYKALSELDPKNYAKWETKYRSQVVAVRTNQNILNAKRQARIWDF